MNNIVKKLIASLILVVPLVVPGSTMQAFAQAGAPAAASGPIDIQANEQEFAGEEVIAKGNVRVKYKDSTVFAPVAHLIRDAGGNPQRAIFTGHPRLIQGNNKIDAEQLTFEVANSKVIAEGHAHSEVMDNGGGGNAGSTDAAKKEDNDADDQNDDKTDKAKTASKPAAKPAAPAAASSAPGEKIITDSDHQEYDRSTGKFLASGHVHVVHGDILVKSDKLQLVYGLDNKPETALFTGNVSATQNRNTTIADSMIYSLSNRRLQATGHVKSTVIQEQRPAKKKSTVGFDPIMPAANAAEVEDGDLVDDVVVVTSQTQDYSKDTNRMSANGNVRVHYQDMVAAGPAAILIRNSANKIDKIVFQGRSQVSQPGKRWIADHIEMTIADKKVIATGNTKAVILQMPKNNNAPAPQSSTKLAGTSSVTH